MASRACRSSKTSLAKMAFMVVTGRRGYHNRQDGGKFNSRHESRISRFQGFSYTIGKKADAGQEITLEKETKSAVQLAGINFLAAAFIFDLLEKSIRIIPLYFFPL